MFFPAEVFDEFRRLIKVCVREHKIFISDRKLVKLYKLFRVRAWLLTGGTVMRDDLRLLAYLGETHREIELLRDKVPQLLRAGVTFADSTAVDTPPAVATPIKRFLMPVPCAFAVGDPAPGAAQKQVVRESKRSGPCLMHERAVNVAEPKKLGTLAAGRVI